MRTFGNGSFTVIRISGYAFPSVNRTLYGGLYFLMRFASSRNASISDLTGVTRIVSIFATSCVVFSPRSVFVK